MAFAARLRAERRSAGLTLTALVASLSLGSAAVPPAPVQVVSGPSVSSVAPREFADTSAAKRRTTKTVQNRIRGGKPKGLDSRKARRRILMQMAGLDNTGRQWVRLRRGLRHGSSAILLATPAWKLTVLRDQFGLRLAQSA